ncbi:hypothetical protein SDC9_138099 [bioreactor metagenome]|uniref:Uncharacterized protein n=1 Tax=bioreactor metagenome TaxID=1076179 RepID=A0A645DP08_9ZZZZ
MAIGRFAGFFVIALVVGFGDPEPGERFNPGGDIIAFAAQNLQQFLRRRPLFGVEREDGRTVLGAVVGPLAVALGGIVNFQKITAQFFIVGPARIVNHFHRFGMAGPAGADHRVGREGRLAAGVAADCGDDAGLIPEEFLHAPEAAAGENRAPQPRGTLGLENQRDGIHAVTHVLAGQFFAGEDMAEVSAAAAAADFGAFAVGIGGTFDRTGQCVVKRGPAAVGVEFVIGVVQWRAAASAGVQSGFGRMLITAGKWRFRTLVGNDPGFFGREFAIRRSQWRAHQTVPRQQKNPYADAAGCIHDSPS